MNKENIFKAYFITHSLLSDFQDKGGFCAMMAEEGLLWDVCSLIENKIDEKAFLDNQGFVLGLKKRNLTTAFKRYEKYRSETDE